MQPEYIKKPISPAIEIGLSDLSRKPIWAARGKQKGKFRRVPVNPLSGGFAKANDPDTWSTRKIAKKRASRFAKGNEPGVGLMLGGEHAPSGHVVGGVDLDSCRDAKTGELDQWAADVVKMLDSYTEVSPSGTGLHVLFLARRKDFKALQKSGLVKNWGRNFSKGDHTEIGVFFGNKFLTVTDNQYGSCEHIRPVDLNTLEWLLGDYGPLWVGVADAGPDHDISGSGCAWRFALARWRDGMNRDEVTDAFDDDTGDAGVWWCHTDDRQRDRVLDKTRAQVDAQRTTTDFEEVDDEAGLDPKSLEPPGSLPEPKPERLTFLTPDDCAALPARDYLVKSLIAPGQVGCIFGEPGAGKSLLAPWLGYAIARGAKVFGLRTRQGGVFYVACEDEDGMAGRITALRDDLEATPSFQLVRGASDLFTQGQVEGKGSPDLQALREAVKRERPKLIIIDTLAMAMPGLEENDAAGMNRVIRIGRTLARHGAAVIFVHHGTKADGSTPRGHSTFNGALAFSIMVKAADKSGVVRGVIRKNRNGPPDLDIAFRVNTRHVGVDIDGEPIYAPICEPCDPISGDGQPPLPKPAQAALDHLWEIGDGDWVAELEWRDGCTKDRRVSTSEILKSRQTAFRRQAKELLVRGEVEFENGRYRPSGGFEEVPDDPD